MPTVNVRVKAVHARDARRTFAASVTAINLNGPNTITEEIPQSGGPLELEIGARYDFIAALRNELFQDGRRFNVPIRGSTREVRVPIAPMGEECRIWLEDIKRMIEKGEHKKAKREIRLAKKVYKHLDPPVPEEVVKILELEKEMPRV